MTDSIVYRPIGIIHSPYKTLEDMPIQPAGAKGKEGLIIVRPEFSKGLRDIEGFSHLYILYHFHRVKETRLEVTPFLDSKSHGVFATRAPVRPNPIGLSVVRLTGRSDNELRIVNVDVLDGTPLLDIKPYVPEFDVFRTDAVGWLEQSSKAVASHRSDDRFSGS
ncbi:MAG: tRNA (N6-threonylcarbamoyladenosine(37)-N6)-methyltransferase TrmO [Syntrophobacteraceae bacterium]|nr:tRNA (N6-threonylcarbamoyladenosine(37)-N6)-methyltransferase TrmO [Syntrophobacteraceae bacterium]